MLTRIKEVTVPLSMNPENMKGDQNEVKQSSKDSC